MTVKVHTPHTTFKLDISMILEPQNEKEEEEVERKVTSTGRMSVSGADATEEMPRGPAGRPTLQEMSPSSEELGTPGYRQTSQARGRRQRRQSKWTGEEDALNIMLRGRKMKWGDISHNLPGRSDTSCRLRYQNYLERRGEWDEEKKNKLARLYERLKQEMWHKIAEEMATPWRTVEAMHWRLGEQEMARRADKTPFVFSNPPAASPPRMHRNSLPGPRSSISEHSGSTQLPSLSQLTAGIPAYASHPSDELPAMIRGHPRSPTEDMHHEKPRKCPRARARR